MDKQYQAIVIAANFSIVALETDETEKASVIAICDNHNNAEFVARALNLYTHTMKNPS